MDMKVLLTYALKGLDFEISQALELKTQLQRELEKESMPPATAPWLKKVPVPLVVRKPRKRMSAAARRRISEGMKERYRTLRKLGVPLKGK